MRMNGSCTWVDGLVSSLPTFGPRLFGGYSMPWLQLLLIRDPHYVPWHRRYACLAWFTQVWRPTSLLVEMDSPNLGLPCGWASPLLGALSFGPETLIDIVTRID